MYFRSSENHHFCCGFSLTSCHSCPPGMGQGCQGPRWVPHPHGRAEPRCGVGAHGETPQHGMGSGAGGIKQTSLEKAKMRSKQSNQVWH